MDQLSRLRKRELICLLLFICNYVVSVWRGFLFPWVLGMGKVILLWHSLSLPYNCLEDENDSEYVKLSASLFKDDVDEISALSIDVFLSRSKFALTG